MSTEATARTPQPVAAPASPADMAAVIEHITSNGPSRPLELDASDASFVLPVHVDVGRGRQLVDIGQAYRALAAAPVRVRRETAVYDTKGFIDAMKLQTREATSAIVYAVPPEVADQPTITAVCDDDRNGDAGWRDIRIVYAPALSEQWTDWMGASEKWMGQTELAEFLEAHISDVILPETITAAVQEFLALAELRLAGPAALNTLARNVAINADVRVSSAITLASGEIAVHYEETHKDAQGAPIKVPNAFVIAVPVFFNGPRYQMIVRLRYRIAGGKIVWGIFPHEADRIAAAAFAEILDTIDQAQVGAVILGQAPAVAKVL